MPKVSNYDPLRAFKFIVSVAGAPAELGFQKVSGLKTSSDVIEYREGNVAIHKRKIPGLTNYEPITLTKGATPEVNEDFLQWRTQVAMAGTGAKHDEDGNKTGDPQVSSPAEFGDQGTGFRKEVTIEVYDKGFDTTEGKSARTYKLRASWPSEMSIADLNAEASEILIETLVLQHEGLLMME
jgi:phage tail-like protein